MEVMPKCRHAIRFVILATAAVAGCSLAGCSLAAGIVTAAEQWSRFRGPNGSGVASDGSFPATWTEDDYLWKAPLPGRGHSSPVAWDDVIFVTVGDETSGALTLLALDAETGAERWRTPFDSAPHSLHAANSYASSTPVVDAERTYVTWATPDSLQAAAVDRRGDVVWRRDLGPADYKHGYGGSPIVVDDLLIVANDHTGDSFVAALDAKTGKTRWVRPRQGGTESYATPLVIDNAGEQQIIVCSSAEGIAALSPSDGAVVWQLPGIYPARCVNSPIAANGLVFTGSGEGGNGKNLTAVKSTGAQRDANAAVAYELNKVLPQVPTPIVVGECLFTWSDRGVVSCYDAASGDQRWTKRIGGNYFGSPVAAGGKLYGVSADGEAVALAATDEYQLLGRSSLGEGSHATPAIHQGKMFLRTESTLACLPAE